MSCITIVSGLPRSGTSLMMQMLAAGGMVPLTDQRRSPDADNPRGYYELDAVKRTRSDASWVPQAEGKAVKVVHALLAGLPDGFDYRVILMQRPLEEVIRSQGRMLERNGRLGANIAGEHLARIFLQQLRQTEEHMAGRPAFQVLPVHYHDCLQRPLAVAEAVCGLLKINLDTAAMAAAVDPLLYRNRLAPEELDGPASLRPR